MELIINSLTKQYYSKLDIKINNTEGVLSLVFVILSFVSFVFSYITHSALRVFFLILAIIFFLLCQILSSISENKFYSNPESVSNKKDTLIYLNELLRQNKMIKLDDKDSIKHFYNQVEKYYEEKISKIKKTESILSKVATVVIIPATFVIMNQMFNYINKFEDIIVYTVTLVFTLLAILFAVYQTYNLYQVTAHLFNYKLKLFLDDLTILTEFEMVPSPKPIINDTDK